MSETGKSHFLSVICGDGTTNDETLHPTNGYYCETLMHAGVTLDCVEFGWLVVQRGCRQERKLVPGDGMGDFDVLLWFIDEHDGRADVQLSQSHMLGFVMAQQQVPLGLCVILNRGRPHASRHVIKDNRWHDDDGEHRDQSGMSWETFKSWIALDSLAPHFPRGVHASELSYRDGFGADLILDWVAKGHV